VDDRGSSPGSVWESFSSHHVQTSSTAHTTSYPMDHRKYFDGVKKPGRETEHSYTAWCSVKHRVNFSFYLYSVRDIFSLENKKLILIQMLKEG
jgi:hypothetical protein